VGGSAAAAFAVAAPEAGLLPPSGRGKRPSLTSCWPRPGDKKIEVIKEVRALTGTGPQGSEGPR